jgi:DNA-binding transcriptional ArsR family regulator
MNQQALRIVNEPQTVWLMMHPARLKVLASLNEPDSAAGVGRCLGLPRQQVHYHLRDLERAGLVEKVGERRQRGCMETLLQATAKTYIIDPAILGESGKPSEIRDQFSLAYLLTSAWQVIKDLPISKNTLGPPANALRP